MDVPVPVSPVKEIFATRGSATRALPTRRRGRGARRPPPRARPPDQQLAGASGRQRGVRGRLEHHGAAARQAGAIFQVAIMSGSSTGRSARTPTASRSTTPSPALIGATSPLTLSAAPPKYSRVRPPPPRPPSGRPRSACRRCGPRRWRTPAVLAQQLGGPQQDPAALLHRRHAGPRAVLEGPGGDGQASSTSAVLAWATVAIGRRPSPTR